MRIKGNILRKIISALSSVLLLLNAFTPYLLIAPVINQVRAQEETVTSTVEPTQDPTPVNEESTSLSPTEEPTPTPAIETAIPTPTVEVTPTIEETPIETITPTETPTLELTEAESVPSPPVEEDQIIESEESAKLVISFWQSNSDGSETTAGVVSLNQTYQAPQNDKVTVTFTRLPEVPGTLTINEVKLSPAQVDELGTFSDTAYDITSDMADGTFTYNLTLPIPETAKGKTIEVKSGETVDEVTTNAEVVDEPKEVESEIITITGLGHFTVFVLVNNVDGDDEISGTSDDVANGVISAIDDAYVDEANPDNNYNTNGLHVRSSSGQDRRIFISFDVGDIEVGSTVTKATFRLFTFDDAPTAERNYQVYRVTEGWDEESLTWNNQPGINEEGATTSSSTPSQGSVWMEFDVTDDVQNFIDGFETNYGWLIKDSDEDSVEESYLGKFRSTSGSNIRRRPQLVVDFAGADVQTEYNSPNIEAADEEIGNGGNGFEDTPDGAFSDGGDVALNDNGINDRHVFSDYGFGIPGSALINGIEVRLDWYLDFLGEGTNSMLVELSGDGGESWTNAKEDIVETNREHIASLGAKDDTWGAEWTWTPDNFSDANFRVRVTANSNDLDRDFYLDWIPVRVYYSDGDGGEDTTAPVSQIDSPEEGFTTNSPIDISGSSSDESLDTVDYVQLFYRESVSEGEENEWTEIDTDSEAEGIQPLDNEIDEPFEWNFNWTPSSDGTFDIKAEATDTAGNTESSPQVNDITYDTTPPTEPIADPAADDYTSNQQVSLSSTGESAIYYTIDGSTPDNTKTPYSGAAILVDHDMTIKAIAYDNAGNTSTVLSAVYGIAPVISSETSTLVGTTSTTITWTTDDLSTSRVIYDTTPVSDATVATFSDGSNYGYANSTIEDSTPVTSHSVGVTGLTSGTTYYYRTISHGSPDTVSAENSFKTDTSSGGGGGTVAGASAPVCSDQKPGSAPVLLSAVTGINSVTLTWAKASDPVSYYLMTFGTSPGAQTYGNPNVGGSDATSYTVSGLSGGATYYFKVRAGNGCAPGPFSNEVAVTPSGGFIAGVPAGFAPGVLGEATTAAELTPTVTNVSPSPAASSVLGQVQGLMTKKNNWKYLLLLAPLILLILYFWRKRSS